MFECWWQNDGFEAWHLRGDLRGASRRWQHRLQDELWLWINHSGEGVVWGKDHRIFLRPDLFGCFGGQEGEDWKWTRLPGQHDAEILVIPRDYMVRHFADLAATKRTPFARWLRGESGTAFAGKIGKEEAQLGRMLTAAWKSRTLPVRAKRLISEWTQRVLGAPQPLTPRASAKGRKRTSSQVNSRKPTSHHIQCDGGTM